MKINKTSTPTKIPSDNDSTYFERSRAMITQTQVSLIASMREQFVTMCAKVEMDTATRLEVVNLAREIGRSIELFTGHQKLLPLEFNRLMVAPGAHALAGPESGSPSIAFARQCLSAHHQYPEPITKLAVANDIFKRLLVQLDLLPKPERGEQESHPAEPLAEFWTEASRLANHMQRLTDDFNSGDISASALGLYCDAIINQLNKFITFRDWFIGISTKHPPVIRKLSSKNRQT